MKIMKKGLLFLLTLLTMGVSSVYADQKYAGHTPADVQSATAANSKTFYLYNLATGQMLDKGGLWGTQPALGAGIPMTLTTISATGYTGTYSLYTGFGTGKYLTFIDGTVDGESKDYGQWYIDQGASAGARRYFTFTEVTGTDYTNAYKLSITTSGSSNCTAGTYYLTAEAGTTLIGATTTEPTNEYGYWILVTHQDLLDAFKVAAEGAAGASAVNATFDIKDYDFARENGDVSNWIRHTGTAMVNHDALLGSNGKNTDVTPSSAYTTSGNYTYSVECNWTGAWSRNHSHTFTYTSSTALTEGTRTSNFLSSSDCSSQHYFYNPTSQVVTLTSAPGITVSRQYYVGNGYGSNTNLSTTTGGYVGNEGEVVTGTDAKAQRYYGADWTANIHGASGKLYQTMSITLAAGKYTIECEGFSTDGSGKLFAQVGNTTTVGDQYQEIAFIKPATTPNTYVSAAKLINGDDSYKKSVTVIVPEPAKGSTLNTTLTFGVIVEDGAADAWSCFDNFKLTYLGQGANVIILDEEKTNYAYINQQVETDKASTIYLNRAMKTGQWNSIVLPVSLTTDQVKEAFGADAKLSVLDRTEKEGKQIIFEPVSLAGSMTAMEKGIVYIIKPTKEITSGDTKTSTKISDLSVSKYYTISLVTFKEGVENGSVAPTDVVGSTEDNGIKHCGTYVKAGSAENPAISKGTYILSNGKWYYNTVDVNTVKGFRGWIATNQGTQGAKSVVINGVEEELGGSTTAIDGIATDQPANQRMVNGIFSLNGQKLSDGNSTDGLAKGVYIVGGKKVVVK